MAAICISEIEDDLLLNADFEEFASVVKARKFISAAKRWLIVQPLSTRDQAAELIFNGSHISTLLKRAIDYVAANDADNSRFNGSVRFLGFSTDWRG